MNSTDNTHHKQKSEYAISPGALQRVIFAGSLLSTSIMLGCGSGGGEGDTPTEPTAAASSTITTSSSGSSFSAISSQSSSSSSSLTAPDISTQDLVASPDFTFSTQKVMGLTIVLPNTLVGQRQLLVYSEYAMAPDNSQADYLPNFRTLISQSRLQSASNTLQLTLPANTHKVLAEIWPLDGGAPEQRLFDLTDNGAEVNWEL